MLLLQEECGFRKGHSCIDDVFALKQIIQERGGNNLKTHIAFVDYIKAFDNITQNKLWEMMLCRDYTHHLILAIQETYQNHTVVIDLVGKFWKR
jgi:hypothetical protein